MLPTIKEAKIELEIAEKLNPGPWIEHSLNVGVAARNIAKKCREWTKTKPILWECFMILDEELGL